MILFWFTHYQVGSILLGSPETAENNKELFNNWSKITILLK